MKKCISILLALLIFASVCVVGVSAANYGRSDLKSIKNVNDAMKFARSSEPVTLQKGTLYNNGKKQGTVYCIGLTGTNGSFDPKVVNGIYSCLRAGTSNKNTYFDLVKDIAVKDIPKGSKIVFFGHSLGGMVAQQFAADPDMKARYQIVSVLTMGSPYIVVDEAEGQLHRMADQGDIIPMLSTAGIGNTYKGNFTVERCGYFGRPDSAHNVSYKDADNWKKYDAFGIEGGSAKIYLW